jgi:hypothetical protein
MRTKKRNRMASAAQGGIQENTVIHPSKDISDFIEHH